MLSLPGPRQELRGGNAGQDVGPFRRRAEQEERKKQQQKKAKGQAARHTEKQSATARPVFTFRQRCADMKRGSGVLWQALLLFIPVSDKENKAPVCFSRSPFAWMRHKAAGWPHPPRPTRNLCDRRLVRLSGHFLRLPTPRRSGNRQRARAACRCPPKQTGLLGPNAGGRERQRGGGPGLGDFSSCPCMRGAYARVEGSEGQAGESSVPQEAEREGRNEHQADTRAQTDMCKDKYGDKSEGVWARGICIPQMKLQGETPVLPVSLALNKDIQRAVHLHIRA